MTSSFAATNPEGISFTMTITMSLQRWMELRASLQQASKGPRVASDELTDSINDMVMKAAQHFIPDSKA